MTANVSLGPELSWSIEGPAGGSEFLWQNNVSELAFFNCTAYIAPAIRGNMTTNPDDTVFGTFSALMVYTDNFGDFPRTIVRTVSFALNSTTRLLPPRSPCSLRQPSV